MASALDEVAFLANSDNRVAVLEAVTERPRGRAELMDEIDVSRVTIARILGDLEDRAWVERSGPEYRATELGEMVIDEFGTLVESMAYQQELRAVLEWLPPDLLTFDLERLCGAEVTLLGEYDLNVLMRRIDEFHRSGDRSRAFAIQVTPPLLETLWEVSTLHGARLDWVVTPSFLDGIRIDRTAQDRFREMIELEHVSFTMYEDVPLSVGIVDGSVRITLSDGDGVVRGGLRTDDDVVHRWAVDLFEAYRERGRPVDHAEVTV